ncbi:MAG TPA: succinate dehydrogenase cytochrome b subunit [Vicinamibacterales bacterium]|nr:succinate dehydrogenase cytochrome b subunit [Vicinamibacterales bacterium]
MASRTGVFSSSVGTKIAIGLTGVLLFIYLLIHIAGNLIVFFGPAAFNTYAFTLESNPLLPLVELVLLSWFVIHIYKTVRMFLANQNTRPVAYAKKKSAGHTTRKTLASTTMIVSGLWLLAFLVIHVKAFHDGWGREYAWPAGGRDLYRQEMETFQNPLMVGFYVISMIVVGSHLWHGISSAFQSLGVDKPAWTRFILPAGKVIAVLIAGGFIVIALWAHFSGVRS